MPLDRIPDWVVDNYRLFTIAGTVVFVAASIAAVWLYLTGASTFEVFEKTWKPFAGAAATMVAGFVMKEFGE